jgi:hypothetical protein
MQPSGMARSLGLPEARNRSGDAGPYRTSLTCYDPAHRFFLCAGTRILSATPRKRPLNKSTTEEVVCRSPGFVNFSIPTTSNIW